MMKRALLAILFLLPISFTGVAQVATAETEKVTSLTTDADTDESEWEFWWSAGANVASNYLWRGYDQSYYGNVFDPAIQPSVTLGYGGFYVDLWYNFSALSTYQELDMTLGFDYENLPVDNH